MFNNLFTLYRSNNGNRTPFEDFNTECFAGILNFYPEILAAFASFLKLPPGNYKIRTQDKYVLPKDSNCIIDMVLESDEVICFIENKVNSKTGWEQLERYVKVLEDRNDKITYLRYCTKNVDIKKDYGHYFFQFRWFHIAKFLERDFIENAMVKNYINFLKQQQMARDTSISTDTVVALKHFLKTYEAMDFHIDNAVKEFKNQFPKAKLEKQEKIPKIREHDRIARSISDVLQNKAKHTEILYSIHFEGVRLQCQLWIHKSHPQALEIAQRGQLSGLFDSSIVDEYGANLKSSVKLYQFIGRKNSDQEIKEWFEERFARIRKFIDDNLDLNWDPKVSK